jgi:hypothetical protein
MRNTPRPVKEAQYFFGEQRVALGLIRQLPRQIFRQGLDAEPRLGKAPDIARRQRRQTERRHHGGFTPGRQKFWPPRMEDEQSEIGFVGDDPAQNFQRNAVDPMQVLEQQHDRRDAAARREQGLQQVARAQANQHAIEADERALGRLEAEQIEQQADIFKRMQAQQIKAAHEFAGDLVLSFARFNLKGAAHHFDERQKRCLLTVGR